VFLTCSIRRKLFVQFALVFFTLLIMAIASIVGLVSYRHVVTDLEFSIKDAPRKADLIVAIDILFEPLLHHPPENGNYDPENFAAFQHQQFGMALRRSKEEIREFLQCLDNLPPNSSIQADDYSLLRTRVVDTVTFLEEQQMAGLLIDPKQRQQQVGNFLQQLNALHKFVNSVPDPFEVFLPRLAEAERNLQACLTIVVISFILAFLLFLGVVGWSNHWIFEPIQVLHKAAKRVANGDFQYRAELKKTGDEMNDLADVFNQVTAQFHEINQDLDRKVNEKTKALIRSERLAGVGFLASGVAHEINNPLHVISTIADSLEMQAVTVLEGCPEADREVFTKYLGMIQTEAFRCQEITEKLLSFARGQEVTRAQTNLTELTNDVVSMVSHLSKFRDRIVKVITVDPVYAEVNSSEMKQVVLNMVSNALESMDPGGKLEIELMPIRAQVNLIFRDNGCGMTPETQEQLFDPFFTQRKGGGGTGLGLSITHRIVEDHNGSIEVSSDGPGMGSTFRIRIPRRVDENISEETIYEESGYYAA